MMIDWTDGLMIDDHDRDGRRGMYGPGKALGDVVSSFSCTLSCIARESGINNLPMLHNLFYLIFSEPWYRCGRTVLSSQTFTTSYNLAPFLTIDADREQRQRDPSVPLTLLSNTPYGIAL
jgi:hypothetical protein